MNKLKNFTNAILINSGFVKEALSLIVAMLGFFILMVSFGWFIKLFFPFKINPTAPYIYDLFATGSLTVITILLFGGAVIILWKFYEFLKEAWENS